MSIPAHLQSTFDLLATAFGNRIDEQDYLALLAVLAEHMCEENIGIVVAHQFERDEVEVVNDLARVRANQPPRHEVIRAVRSRLEKAGLEDWINEDDT